MRPTTWNDANGVQFVIDTPLPSVVRHELREQAQRFLDRYRRHGGSGQLVVHVKRVGPQVGCHVHLFADRENQHGFETDWDVRRALDSTLAGIETRLQQQHERRSDASA